jgi:hypothetical protein
MKFSGSRRRAVIQSCSNVWEQHLLASNLAIDRLQDMRTFLSPWKRPGETRTHASLDRKTWGIAVLLSNPP